MNSNVKKVAAAAAIVAFGAASLGLGYAMHQPEPRVVTKEITIEKEVPVKVIEEVIKNVTVEVPVEVVKEIPVDNGKLDVVLQHVFDNDGNVEYLIDHLKDSEVAEIADRVVFVNDIKMLAVDYVKEKIAREADREEVDGVQIDDRDIEKVRVDDDFDEISVEDIDFDDKDAELLVTGSFEHDHDDYEFSVIVKVKDGEVDDLSDLEITRD